jgi:hypothetical protein
MEFVALSGRSFLLRAAMMEFGTPKWTRESLVS